MYHCGTEQLCSLFDALQRCGDFLHLLGAVCHFGGPADLEPWNLDLYLLGLDSDTFYIYHVAAVMVDNLRRLLLGINLSDKAIMDFDFPGVGFPV